MSNLSDIPSAPVDLGLPPEEEEPHAVASRTPMQLAMRRFRKDKISLVSLVLVVMFVVLAIAAPFLVAAGALNPNSNNTDLLDDLSLPIGSLGGMSWDHPLGVEPSSGRDTLSLIWLGLSFSLGIALVATMIAVTLGVVAGIVSGTAGGWVDSIIGRGIDLTLAFPQTLMLLALSSTGVLFMSQVLGIPEGTPAQFAYVVIVLGLFGWTGIARLVRGQVLSLREREFVHAAQLMGASRFRIYFKEIMPNLWAPILVQFTLIMPAFISAEAALSYLGVSVNPPTPTLGNVLAGSLIYAETAPIFFLAPAVLIATLVVSFNLLGDGLRDALDPTSDT